MIYTMQISSGIVYIIMLPHRIKERTSHLFDYFIDYKMMRDARVFVWAYDMIFILRSTVSNI
jgi:hypothetical protein